MSTCRPKVIIVCALAAGVLALIWAATSAAPPLVMTVRGLTAKQWPEDIANQVGRREYVVATIELTNGGKRPIAYRASDEARFPEFSVLHQTTTGWKEEGRGFCGTGVGLYTLAPSGSITFDAIVDRDKPCKVALSYSDGRTPSRLWQRLPRWLAQRLPWGSGWSTVTTHAIDLRGAALPSVKRPEPFMKPPEETPVIAAAAERGEADAQFRLAGRYLTGSGGVEKSVAEALRWYAAAATNGHAEAAYNLGTIHEYGLAAPADQARAIEWYRRASDRGHLEAQERLRALASQVTETR